MQAGSAALTVIDGCAAAVADSSHGGFQVRNRTWKRRCIIPLCCIYSGPHRVHPGCRPEITAIVVSRRAPIRIIPQSFPARG